MQLQFLQNLTLFSFILLVLLSLALVFHKGNNHYSNRLLAFFLIAKAICVSNMVAFFMYPFFHDHFPFIFYFGSSFTLMWGPLLYFYIRSLTQENSVVKPVEWLHCTPAFLNFLYFFIRYHRFSPDIQRQLVETNAFYNSIHSFLYLFYLQSSIFIYTMLCFIMLYQYRKEVKQQTATFYPNNLSWVYLVLVGFSAKWFFDSLYLFNRFIPWDVGMVAMNLSKMSLFLFVSVLVFKSIQQPDLLFKVDKQQKYKQSKLSSQEIDEYLAKLQTFMRGEKPYLEPTLCLNNLADMIGIPPRHLSQIINDRLNQNFYDFINSYRIEESKQYLKTSKKEKTTILEILYEVGFNSKSAFNAAFKEYTGMTPTQFIRSQEPVQV